MNNSMKIIRQNKQGEVYSFIFIIFFLFLGVGCVKT